MHAKWIVSICSSCMSALTLPQVLLGTRTSEVGVALQSILFAAKAVLLIAVGRPHPKVTNY
jgi:branched-subunit amino acid transport protein